MNNGTWPGLWSQYVARDYLEVFVYDQSLPHEVGCGMNGNPLTAVGVLKQCQIYKPKAVILQPGAAQIAKILERLYRKDGIKVISLVRNKESHTII